MDFGYIFGSGDYKDYLAYKKKSDPSSKAEAGKRLLWNGNIIEAEKSFDGALNPKSDSEYLPSNERPEIANLHRLTKELDWRYFSFLYSSSNIDLRQETVGFIDSNGDGRKQPWEQYNYQNNRPDYQLVDGKQKRESWALSFRDPAVELGPFQGNIGVEIKREKRNDNTSFIFDPYIDPAHPERTPQYLKDLAGTEHVATEFGPIDSQKLDFNLTLPMFGVWKDLPVLSQLLNTVSVGGGAALTERRITDHPEYQYNEVTKKLESPTKEKLFLSSVQYLEIGFASRTFPLFNWPYSIYPRFIGEGKYSVLYKNMPNQYNPSARNYVVPSYYKDTLLTAAQRGIIGNNYFGDYLPNSGVNDALTAKQIDLGLMVNFPGLMQLLRDTSVVDQLGFAPGDDYPIKASYRTTWHINDSIRNTDNGLYPAQRDHFAEWHLDPSGNLVKAGSDLHEKLEPVNGRSWEFSVEHKFRLGHLNRIKSPWDKGYFSGDFSFFSLKTLWAIPGSLWPLVRYPISLIDDGFSNSTPVFMPVQCSVGGESYSVGGEKKKGSSQSFGVGISAGRDSNLSLMLEISNSDNGYNFKEKRKTASLTWQF